MPSFMKRQPQHQQPQRQQGKNQPSSYLLQKSSVFNLKRVADVVGTVEIIKEVGVTITIGQMINKALDQRAISSNFSNIRIQIITSLEEAVNQEEAEGVIETGIEHSQSLSVSGLIQVVIYS